MDQEPKVPSLYHQKALPNMPTEEEKSREDSVPLDTPSSVWSSQKVWFDTPNLRTFIERLHQKLSSYLPSCIVLL
jgi:hypothetical protein